MKDAIVNESSTYTEDELQTLRRDFFSYYRRLRGYLFSDTEIIYETKLTREVFDLKLQQLSQDKKQSEFENFALAAAARMVTPNIKPQTGPDGGGDGKVDGETYPVWDWNAMSFSLDDYNDLLLDYFQQSEEAWYAVDDVVADLF